MYYEVSNNSIKDMEAYLSRDKKYLIIVDDFIYHNYKSYIEKLRLITSGLVYRLPSGETSKNHSLALSIIDVLIENNFTREDLIINLGGGVVTDLGGFVASIYMRGIGYINIPTTLLSQVDSSIGGKVGINYKSYKNIIGNFCQPEAVFIDTSFLSSLSRDHILSGFGEIFKYGLIDNEEIFFKALDIYGKGDCIEESMEDIIRKSIETKLSYTDRDFKDRSDRQILNFGHSIGHALESLTGFKEYSHGEAVIVGMIYESYLAYSLKTIAKEEVEIIIENLMPLVSLKSYSLDDREKILELLYHDKKNTDSSINMVLPSSLGKAKLYKHVPEDLIMEALKGDWIEK